MDRRLEIDNRTLVEECKKGDREALNLFYLRFAPRMLSVIRRYVGDLKDSEDILHDGFIVAFTRLKSLRDPDRVDYWLATIMKNLSLRFLQEQDVAQLLHEQKDLEDAPEIDSLIDMGVLESLILKMPAGYQNVFRLAMLENKSHKEIAKILGISPNTSSSQLFHAKLMMRRLITDYKKQAGLLCLLLLMVGTAFKYVFNHVGKLPEKEHVTMNAPDLKRKIGQNIASAPIQERRIQESAVVLPNENKKVANKSLATNFNLDPTDDEHHLPMAADNEDALPEIVSETTGKPMEPSAPKEDIPRNPSSQKGEEVVNRPQQFGTQSYAIPSRNGVEPTRHGASRKGWSVITKVDAGFLAGSSSSNSYFFTDAVPGGPILSGGIISSIPDVDYYAETSHRNDFPISFSLAVSRNFTDRISLETGLSYTYLSTTFEINTTRYHARWHYLGIPLRVNFRTFATGRLKFYGAVGGSLEIPLYSSSYAVGNRISSYLREGHFNSPCVWTLSASYGGAFKLSERLELFIEPTVQLFLHNKATVPNAWSDNRVGFSLPIGVRFNW